MTIPQDVPAAYRYTAPPELGQMVNLPTFLDAAGQLTLDEQKLIVDQAQAMLENAYVHLPMKRAIHAIDPVQALRLLRRRLDGLSKPMPERRFHDEMIDIFVSLRDLHTNYILPSYFSASTAILPFYLEEVVDDHNTAQTQYVVSKMIGGFTHPQFQPGVTVKYWNGVPIARAVEVNGELNAGSNPDARHARGLEAMTLRPMSMSLPPDEEWVVVGYEKDNQSLEVRIPWLVFQPDTANGVALSDPSGTAFARVVGMDFQTEMVRRTKVRLFVPEVAEKRRMLTAALAHKAPPAEMPANPLIDILNCRTVDTPSGKFGYLRIFSFAPPDDLNVNTFLSQFFSQVVAALHQFPPDGLIVDVRGNGGGVILAGEMLLQLLTPRHIAPERFDFINSPVTRQITASYDDLKPWAASVAQAVETAAVYSQGLPLTSEQDANSVGQLYQGPVVLITDALIYSTTDIFTAGFRDHNIGRILGTSGNVGAGGANVWDYGLLQRDLPAVFRPLPRGTSMRVAMRRATRVGAMTGIPLEELGVIPDDIHHLTRNDVFHDNVDLIAHAARLLHGQRIRKLNARFDTAGGKHTLTVTTLNLSRVDVYVDDRPALSLDVHDGDNSAGVPQPAGPAQIHLEGYDGNELAATRDLAMQA